MGDNVRRLRDRHTTEELASCAQKLGLHWGTARIAELERGKVSATVTTVYLVSLALGDLLGYPIPPDRLFGGDDGDMVATPAGEVELALLRTGVSSVPPKRPKPVESAADHYSESVITDWPEHLIHDVPLPLIRKVRVAMLDTDYRVAAELNPDTLLVAAGMAYLWQKPLSAKRNEEAGADASPQRKGRITLRLKEALRKAID